MTPLATDPLFEQFWSAYPRKCAKKDAQKAWKQAKVTPELSVLIMRAIEAHKQSRQWKDGFIPYAATYLRGERWNDDLQVRPSKAQGWNRFLEDA